MSLINEALKQAKANMAANSPPDVEERPPEDTPPISPIPPAPTTAGRRGSKATEVLVGMLIFLLLALLLAAAAGGIYFIHSMRITSQPGPPSFAGSLPAAGPTAPAVEQTATSGGAVPGPVEQGKKPPAEAGTAAEPKPVKPPRKPNPLAQSLNRAKAIAKTVHNRQMTPTEVVAAKEPPHGPDRTPKPPTSDTKSVQPAPANIIRAYKLTGIVEGPTGRLALINGAIVRQGRPIGDARVREIGSDFVVIEVKGRAYRVPLPGNTGF